MLESDDYVDQSDKMMRSASDFLYYSWCVKNLSGEREKHVSIFGKKKNLSEGFVFYPVRSSRSKGRQELSPKAEVANPHTHDPPQTFWGGKFFLHSMKECYHGNLCEN